MQLYALLALAVAELAAAEQVLPMQAVGGISARQLFAKSEPLFEFSKRATCDLGQIACHTGCIPIGGQCCATTGWCKLGTVCDEKYGGCCPLGKVCTGGPTGGPTCDTGYTPCKDKCMLIGGDCCGDGTFCKAGTKCDGNGGCTTGGTGGGGGGGGGGGNQCSSTQTPCNDRCMPTGSVCCGNGRYCMSGYTCINGGLNCSPGGTGGGGGGGGDGGQCLVTQEVCNGKCMPKGSVCCGNGKYCMSGYTCINNGLNCSPGGSGGGGGGGGGGSDTTTAAEPGTTAQPTYTLTSDNGSGASPTDTQAAPTPPAVTTTVATDNGNPTPTDTGAGTAANSPTTTRAPGAAGTMQVPLVLGAVVMALPMVL